MGIFGEIRKKLMRVQSTTYTLKQPDYDSALATLTPKDWETDKPFVYSERASKVMDKLKDPQVKIVTRFYTTTIPREKNTLALKAWIRLKNPTLAELKKHMDDN